MSNEYDERLRKSLIAIKKLKKELDDARSFLHEPLAIIGMGCRFPGGVTTPEAFWTLLENGINAVGELPQQRWNIEKYHDEEGKPGKMYTKLGGFIEQIDQFDAAYFGISPQEALYLDPQQRLLLEVSYEALERAGQNLDALKGTATGVFIGIAGVDYSHRHFSPFTVDRITPYSVTGGAIYSAAGRISYLLGLEGASMVVSTACSSSLVALHLACQSLRTRESDMVIAGGANLIVSPENSVALSTMNALSRDGKSKAFDAAADGYVRGEGVATVVIKRLSDALRDNDPIQAVIRGTAVNQDGKSNGFTAPSAGAQEKLLRTALANARIAADCIDYIEAHGTGTPLGDPIELEAIKNVFKDSRSPQHPLQVGTVKTNIGHTEGAAGIAGVLKVALSLWHKKLPKNLHFQEGNPYFDWSEMPLKVPAELSEWKLNRYGKRTAGVSGFGISGTNAHAILEEAPEKEPLPFHQADTFCLLPISAKTPQAVRDYALKYVDFLESAATTHSLPDICANATLKRTHFPHRFVAAGKTAEELIAKLEAFAADQDIPTTGVSALDGKPAVAFICPGQGSQWIGMGRELFVKEEAFRNTIVACEKAFAGYVNWSLIAELNKPEAESRYREIDVIQPVLFAIEIALAAAWRAKGIYPDAVAGHSMGEVAAAYIAGALSLEDAANVICTRSKLMKQLSGTGLMMVVEMTTEEARALIKGNEHKVAVAVSNSPKSTVLSGDPAAIHTLQKQLEAREIFCKLVNVDVASHSPQMDKITDELRTALRTISPRKTTIPFYSTVQNKPVSGERLDAEYWVSNLRQAVLFSQTMHTLLEDRYKFFIELSPHPVLKVAMEQTIEHDQAQGYVVPSVHRNTAEAQDLLQNWGRLYAMGYPADWKAIYPAADRFVLLPTYPWQHKRFWLAEAEAVVAGEQPMLHPSTEAAPVQENLLEKLVHASEAEGLELLRPYFTSQLARITGHSASEIPVDAGFGSIGVDSMMIVQLRKKLEQNLSVRFSAKDFWAYPTVNEFSGFLLQKIRGEVAATVSRPSVADSPWLLKPQPKPDARLKLFCFHYAGGSASLYHPWATLLHHDIELVTIQLPGRANRMEEPCYTDMKALVKALLPELVKEFDRPFAFFGHSMGGAVLFELTRELRRRQQPLPIHVLISACPHPKHYITEKTYLLSEEELTREFPSLSRANFSDEEFYKAMLEALRSDLQVIGTHEHTEERPLELPISCLVALQDEKVSAWSIGEWESETTSVFKMYERPGLHHYIHDDAVFITDLINGIFESVPGKEYQV